MLRILHIIILFLLSVLPLSGQPGPECPETDPGEIVIRHAGHTLSYDPDLMLPRWVAYELEAGDLEGNAVRRGSYRGSWLSVAFLMENSAETKGKLRDYTCTVADLEALTGIRFFTRVYASDLEEIKQQIPLKELGLF